jgi:DNA (cytosine-5)-methyltransferase 1
MKYLSVCSGIEAATVAWHPLGWEAAAYSEIEPFPSAVLAHHYPSVPNVGDMTKFKEWNLEPIDLLVGGTPCQSFSVAGLRKGLEDPRGNLALVYCGILDKFRPKWFVWENVPGVLSSNGGRDFGSFLGAVAELGYGFAYRVLDAQYFGVAQRRRRVFVVGYLGDWRPAAEVLFEPESLCRDTAPSRKQGEEVAGTIAARFGISRNNHEECVVSYDMKQHHNPQPSDTVQLTTKNCTFIRGDTPLVQSYAIQGSGSTSKTANGSGWNEEVSFTLNSTDVHGVAQPMVIHGTQDPCVSNVAFAQGRNNGGENVVMQPIGLDEEQNAMVDRFGTLKARMGGGGFEGTVMQTNMAVRRLTPVECERLQGFPDNYTNIPWRKADESPDGPRYKSLGNSMAVPVMAWIGKRIADYEQQTNGS